MVSRFLRWGVGGWMAVVLVHVTVSAAVFYVDSDAPGGGDGKSWAGAYADLGRALDDVIAGDEVRVAGGVYRPGPAGGNRSSSFFINSPIRLIGGFAGAGQPDPDARDIAAYPTILSGDLNGDDAVVLCLEDLLGEPTRQDNAYRVVVFGGNSGESILDGFIITGGNDNGPDWHYTIGAGIYGDNYQADPLIRSCTIEFNAAGDMCGGAYVQGRFADCEVRFNDAAHSGGGLGSVREITRCVIENNAAGDFGGGLFVWFCRMSDSVIRGNTAKNGGGMYVGTTGIEITGSTVNNNIASGDGGGIYVGNCGTCSGFPVLYRCRIIGNTARGNGGGFYENPSEGWLWSCLFVGNTAGKSGGGIYEGTDGYCGIVNCTVFANSAGDDGGGMFYQNTYGGIEGIVTNSIFWGNTDVTGTGTERAQILLIGQPSTGQGPGDSLLSALVNHSCIQGLTFAYPGSGNISADPWFVNFYGEDDQPGTADDDLHLDGESPCINTGDNNIYSCAFGGAGDPGTGTGVFLPTGTGDGTFPGETGYFMCPRALIDLDAWARIRSGRVDMGAYESSVKPGMVIYVDDSAAGSNDGSCWGDAFTDLQDALGSVQPGQEIHVAQGTYRPADPNGSREASFTMKGGVAIRGGYAGYGAANPDDRDIRRYETILSGDLNGNDRGGWFDSSRMDNCINVVMAYGLLSGAVLEGFTITGGYGGLSGGGLYCHTAVGVVVRDCVFRGNFAELGGGMCDFWSSSSQVTNCVFTDNYSTRGGAVYLNGEFCMTLDHCLIVGNQAEWGGGLYLDEAYTAIVNCTVANNDARDQWGGVIDNPGTSYFGSCIFWGNTCDGGSVEWAQIGPKGDFSQFDYCCVQGWTGQFSGVGTIDTNPLFAKTGMWVAGIKGPGGPDRMTRRFIWELSDYHLTSQAGRWDASVKAWVQDAVTSPCIDAGDPGSLIGPEPFPNGGVVNMGVYGGTAEASKSWFGGPLCGAIAAGDINGDCKVDLGDFAILARNWLWENE